MLILLYMTILSILSKRKSATKNTFNHYFRNEFQRKTFNYAYVTRKISLCIATYTKQITKKHSNNSLSSGGRNVPLNFHLIIHLGGGPSNRL